MVKSVSYDTCPMVVWPKLWIFGPGRKFGGHEFRFFLSHNIQNHIIEPGSNIYCRILLRSCAWSRRIRLWSCRTQGNEFSRSNSAHCQSNVQPWHNSVFILSEVSPTHYTLHVLSFNEQNGVVSRGVRYVCEGSVVRFSLLTHFFFLLKFNSKWLFLFLGGLVSIPNLPCFM